jgi:hypothetical protein
MKRSRKAAIIIAAAILGAPAGIVLSQATGDDPPPMWRPTETVGAVSATTAQKDAFPVLGSTQRTQDLDNGLVTQFADRSGVGADATGARVVGATDAGAVWLIPVNGGLCLGLQDDVDTSLGASCEPSEDVIARGLTVGDGGNVYGLVPNGVGTVTVTPTGSTPETVTVDDGMYEVGVDPATVAVDGPTGLTEFSLYGG